MRQWNSHHHKSFHMFKDEYLWRCLYFANIKLRKDVKDSTLNDIACQVMMQISRAVSLQILIITAISFLRAKGWKTDQFNKLR